MSAGQRPTWRSPAWPVTGVVFGGLFALLLGLGAEGLPAVVLPPLIAGTALGVSVWAVQRRRADRTAYEARLTRWAAAEAALAERIRIARDLHDIVSHGLGLITVRAAAARHVRDAGAGPAGAPELEQALGDIEEASRRATGELRRMLTVLRTPADEPPRLPVEGLERLPGIVHGARVAGLRTQLSLEEVGEVSAGVQVAVCRTVREALNNSARHAGPTEVRVRVHRDGDCVVVTVSDTGPDGPWPAAPGAGHGLIGLRERVAGLGGSFSADPVDGGFHVAARFPEAPG